MIETEIQATLTIEGNAVIVNGEPTKELLVLDADGTLLKFKPNALDGTIMTYIGLAVISPVGVIRGSVSSSVPVRDGDLAVLILKLHEMGQVSDIIPEGRVYRVTSVIRIGDGEFRRGIWHMEEPIL